MKRRIVIRGSFCFSVKVMKAKQWSLGMALIGLGLFYLILFHGCFAGLTT